jgi:hypothetical protein
MKQCLINAVIVHKNDIAYICLNNENKYSGWTSDFGFELPDGNRMRLDLRDEGQLFLLFVLASAWSRPGRWENAAFFTAYLAYNGYGDYKLWQNDVWVKKTAQKAAAEIEKFIDECTGLVSRVKVSFRSDYYDSIKVLAGKWEEILKSLKQAEMNQDYSEFICFLSEIEGLGYGTRKMKIKIPLIMRELRCQDVYKGIRGELCCVRDKRVMDAAENIGLKLPKSHTMESIMQASRIIYKNFADLYDIPLFAYEDIKNDLLLYERL